MEGRYNRLADQASYADSSKKHATDLCCCMLFFLNGVVYVLLFFAVLSQSDWDILRPYDSSGRQCGVAPETKNFPYLYYVVPNSDLSYSVCVSDCSAAGNTCLPNVWVTSCDFTYTTGLRVEQVEPYDSTPLFGLVCYPSAEIRNTFPSSNRFVTWILEFDPPESVSQLIETVMTYSLLWFIPLVFCGLYFLILRYFVGTVLWIVVFGTTLLIVFAGVQIMNLELAEDSWNSVLTIMGIMICILAVGYFIFAVYLHGRIELAGVIVKLACSFLSEQFLTLFLGLAFYLCVCASILMSIVYCLIIYTHGSVPDVQASDSPYPSFPIRVLDTKIVSILIYVIFSGFWFIEFWISFVHMIIANTTVTWYFRKRHTAPFVELVPSTLITLRYHMGQVTFGALIQAILWPVNAILSVLKVKLILGYEGPNEAVSFLCGCVNLVFRTLAIGMTVLNRFILINLAYTDNNYCEGLHSSYLLLAKNPVRASVYGLSITFVMVTGLIGLSVSSVFITRFLFGLGSSGSFAYLYVIFTCFSSVFVFLEVFHVITDTILLCLLQDLEDNNKDPPSRQPLATEVLLSVAEV